jgi:hypothetical protein
MDLSTGEDQTSELPRYIDLCYQHRIVYVVAIIATVSLPSDRVVYISN